MAERFKDRRLDPRRRAAVDVALSLAELNAGWGDYERGLEHLAAAEELADGALDERASAKRREWLEEALAKPRP
jgi:hypothetical protein